MKLKYSFIYTSILGFLIAKYSFSQTFYEKDSLDVLNKYDLNTYLVCDAKMNVPELARKIGFKKVSYKATFDIIDYNPQNINIICLDSTEIWFDDFKKSTLSNIKQLEFIKDTLSFSLIFNYNFSRSISADYIDFSKHDIVEMYFKSYYCPIIELRKTPIEIDQTNKTVNLFSTIETNKILKYKSDNLVERIFSDSNDSVIIIKNNLPYFENDIKRIAQSYRKEYVDKKLAEIDCPFVPKHYFINFNIVTIPKQCGCK